MKKIVYIDENLCVGCMACVELCPQKILYVDKKTKKCKVLDEQKCDKLKGCQRICPTEAIRILD